MLARRCGTEGRTGPQGWEGGNGGGNWDRSGDRNEGRYGNEREGGNGSANGDENIYEGGGEREPGNLQSGIINRG